MARDVILQCQSLFHTMMRLEEKRVGKRNVLVEDGFLMMQVVQLQIMPCQEKTYALSVFLRFHLCHLLTELCHTDSTGYGPTAIHHLPCHQSEVVAKVRSGGCEPVLEWTIPDLHISQITNRGCGFKIR